MSDDSAQSKQLSLFSSPQQIQTEEDEWRPIRDDFNFCRLPLFALADQKRDRFRNIRHRYQVEINGRTIDATWEVRHDAELGLPSTFDRDVWWEICARYSEGQRTQADDSGVVWLGALPEFLRSMGKKSDGGNMIARVKESIKRLTVTTCLTEKAFNCPTSGGYLHLMKPIHLIEECAFKGDPDGKGGYYEQSWIKLGEYVRNNLKSGYIALLDVKYIRSLKGELTKQLYPFLSYRFWLAVQRGRDYTSVHWQELANYLAVTGWTSHTRAKQRMAKAISELKEGRYIDETSDWQGDKFLFRIGDQFIDELKNRMKAKDQYRLWIEGKNRIKQLTVLPRPMAPDVPLTDTDEREAALVRQAIRINQLKQQPDIELLTRYGWTAQDALSFAAQLKIKDV
jgi:hypothetical protein